eukprot:13323057-Heterocapsa_arctica.AAC.1
MLHDTYNYTPEAASSEGTQMTSVPKVCQKCSKSGPTVVQQCFNSDPTVFQLFPNNDPIEIQK